MKSNIFNFLLVFSVLITVSCVYIFTACKEKEDTPEEIVEPPPEDFSTPTGFDKKNSGVASGTLTERSYYSTTTEATRKCNVYTPPGYDPDVTYPVMYLLHGIGGNHNEWKNDGGKPNEILSNLINAGKAKPMIVVMPNVRAKKDDNDYGGDMYGETNINAFNNFINDLRDNLMPFIEKEHKVSNERTERAIAGLSMGGLESLYIGISMPEKFGFIGAFSAAPSLENLIAPAKMTLPDEYKNKTFIMICCGLQDNIALTPSRSYNQSLVNNGVKTAYYEMNGEHNFTVWKNGLYNFAKRIF
jgi:enterochelin esterase-like enzyme